jgi:RHS repeat-associated protein
VPLWHAGSGVSGYGFTGERWEAYSALVFLRARYYQPGTGRFVSPDTITPNFAKPSTLNVFLYVDNNPMNYFDPSGHNLTCLNPSGCPLPPSGKVWKRLGHWLVSIYGHADHELWAKPNGDQATVSWKEKGKEETASVDLKWLRNVVAQGTAGKLTLRDENGYREVWLKCSESGLKPESIMPGDKIGCNKKLEPAALKSVHKRVACNPCPLISTYDEFKRNSAWCRDDVKRGDTLCIARWPNRG